MINLDQTFNKIKALRPEREVTFRNAVAYDPATSTVVYAPARVIKAKVWDRPRTYDFTRGIYITDDRTSIIVWFRDWFRRDNDDATTTEVAQMVADAKGQIREGDRERYSLWVVDGQNLKVESHSLIQRPDGKLYAARFWLVAAS